MPFRKNVISVGIGRADATGNLKTKLMTSPLTNLLITFILSSCANSPEQDSRRLVGGPCEGCEAVFEYGDRDLSRTDTLPDFHNNGVRLKVEGCIYHSDGKTPATGVILYVYHTNQEGLYAPKKWARGWAEKHGYNRTWLKTGQDGRYSFYTLKPAPYPNRSGPAHIHYTILEPNGKYYWLGSCHFEGDSLLTEKEINPEAPRGGHSGLLTLREEKGLLVGTRDIVLGKNVPGYE